MTRINKDLALYSDLNLSGQFVSLGGRKDISIMKEILSSQKVKGPEVDMINEEIAKMEIEDNDLIDFNFMAEQAREESES